MEYIIRLKLIEKIVDLVFVEESIFSNRHLTYSKFPKSNPGLNMSTTKHLNGSIPSDSRNSRKW
jgi:hypothetical protein